MARATGHRSVRAEVLLGDCREVLATLADASIDAVVTDPPSGTHFMGLAFDHNKGGRDQWIAWLAGIMAEARRVLKPGHEALVWALPRTSHWTATALEDAGFYVADVITHHFGSGFPKSRSLLKPASEHWILCRAPGPLQPLQIDAVRVPTGGEVIARDFDAQQDSGYGYCRPTPARHGQWTNTAGRWPPNTLLSHHPECQPAGVRRVRAAGWSVRGDEPSAWTSGVYGTPTPRRPFQAHGDADGYETVDAWTCVDGCPVAELDRQAGYSSERPRTLQRNGKRQRDRWGLDAPSQGTVHGDAGGKSRFFPTFGPDPQDAVPFRYVPKASRAERDRGLDALPLTRGGAEQYDSRWKEGTGDLRQPMTRNGHPTVKPTALMAWLVKLVTAPGGVVLDPFCGSGSTGVACVRAGFGFIGIEAEAQYVDIARRRIAHEQEQRAGPLFAGVGTATTAAR